MVSEAITNLARTTLNGAIASAGATSITVASASLFPSALNYRIRVEDEIMLVTGGQGTTTWTVTRGQESTTATTHPNGAMVYGILTAGGLNHFIQNHNHTGSIEGIGISYGIFGDGSDGDVTISGDTTLTRDMFYNSLTVNSTKNLITSGFRVFVKTTLVNNGIIHNNGSNGSGSSGSGGGGGYFRPGQSGATAAVSAYANAMGGSGGNDSHGEVGGVVTIPLWQPRSTLSSLGTNYSSSGTATVFMYGGGGGGGGYNTPTRYGGGGGGVCFVAARSITNNNIMSANGGAGYAASGYTGGGGGGCLIILYRDATWTTETANGGVKGGGTATDGGAGYVIKLQM